MSTKLTIAEMNRIAKSRGGSCLSKKYIDAHTHLKWRCKSGHIWKAKPCTVKYGSWCIVCAGKKLGTIQEMRALAKKNGGKCLSKNYKNKKTKLQWRCKAGHTWLAAPDGIKRGDWCRTCGYEKRAAERRLGIERMREIAKERGGKCLSTKYKNTQTHLTWRCKKGHEWPAVPSHIVQGKWCPWCAGIKKLSIDDCNRAALERGGFCRSKKYVGNKGYLKWECSKGHKWSAKYNYIQQGNWCPHCHSATSYPELLLYSELKHRFKSTEHRKIHFGVESDIFVPELNLSIEVDGGYWHREKQKKDAAKFKTLKAYKVICVNVRQSNLPQISKNDVKFGKSFKDEELVTDLFKMLTKLFPKNRKVSAFLASPVISNRKLLNGLLAKLPGPIEGKSLAEKSPQIASEFHPTLNGKTSAENIHNGSHRKVWWLCLAGHNPFESVVKARTLSGHGCPKCGAQSSIRSRSKEIFVYKGNKMIGSFPSIGAAAAALSISRAAIIKSLAGAKNRAGYIFKTVKKRLVAV